MIITDSLPSFLCSLEQLKSFHWVARANLWCSDSAAHQRRDSSKRTQLHLLQQQFTLQKHCVILRLLITVNTLTKVYITISLWPPGSYANRAGHYVSLLSFRSLFRHIISEIARPIYHQTLLHVRRWLSFIKFGEKSFIFQKKLAAPIHTNFCSISDNLAVWSGISPERNKIQCSVKQETALQTTITPGRTNLIWWTLIYKRQEQNRSFDQSNGRPLRCAVGIAMHSNFNSIFDHHLGNDFSTFDIEESSVSSISEVE